MSSTAGLKRPAAADGVAGETKKSAETIGTVVLEPVDEASKENATVARCDTIFANLHEAFAATGAERAEITLGFSHLKTLYVVNGPEPFLRMLVEDGQLQVLDPTDNVELLFFMRPLDAAIDAESFKPPRISSDAFGMAHVDPIMTAGKTFKELATPLITFFKEQLGITMLSCRMQRSKDLGYTKGGTLTWSLPSTGKDADTLRKIAWHLNKIIVQDAISYKLMFHQASCERLGLNQRCAHFKDMCPCKDNLFQQSGKRKAAPTDADYTKLAADRLAAGNSAAAERRIALRGGVTTEGAHRCPFYMMGRCNTRNDDRCKAGEHPKGLDIASIKCLVPGCQGTMHCPYNHAG
tara:strand:- start:54 stop:1106 length:1053 start_codon:yes stop_codon:yes gene_type:complete